MIFYFLHSSAFINSNSGKEELYLLPLSLFSNEFMGIHFILWAIIQYPLYFSVVAVVQIVTDWSLRDP